MEIEVTDITMNNNLTPQYISTSSSPVAYFAGFKEITFKGRVIDSRDLEGIFLNAKEIDKIKSPRGNLLRCHITNYSYENQKEIFVEGIAEELIPIVDVNFLDGMKSIEAYQYNLVLEKHGKLEEMTFNEFKDYLMLEEL